jgi:UDP-glucose 4-epimerase
LITGGAGFIGSHLAEELLAGGFKVTVIDNLSTGCRENIAHLLKDKNFKFHKNTIMNERLMSRLIQDNDIVYHLAAAVGVKYILDHPLDSILTNVQGTEIVLRLADKYRRKVLITSTSEIYGKHLCSASSEDDDRTLGPTSISRWSYSDSKAIDEFLALAYAKERKLPVVIVRMFNTVGPRQVGSYGMVLPRFIQSALAGKPITVYNDGSQTRSFTYVKDAVWAIVGLSLNKKAEGRIFNIGNDQAVSIKELAEKIKTRSGSGSKIVYISYAKAFGKKAPDFEDMGCRIPDISRVRKLLHYRPHFDLDMMIDETIDYFKGKGK